MKTTWLAEPQLARALERNEAFWRRELDDYPLLWITVPDARPGAGPAEPNDEQSMWTDVDYVMAATEDQLARTH